MNIEDYRSHCLKKKGVTEEFPFDESTLVFKVKGKVFALTNVDDFQSFNVKCDPEKAIDLRERYAGVKPGFHMNKKHWNTISVYSDFNDDQMYEALDHSYDLVFSKLPKKVREELTDD
ncbi:MmcQ/YjbR family DNA-binding protein [Flammeovirga pectinis]|uniref:MmcQ/YjbR family DNA-binding protein n=1 Tax=Flammeovirga pectinis TaxID=2494373 RepID=A0A3S9P2Z9_9BACT|nr:MmcQ/YjbR family DNA-binding protein [Flammeovirga pectinis]AZQ62577.1 MmcQ/YjbR family DNA-binding protein [Flammeovirga pectinis]